MKFLAIWIAAPALLAQDGERRIPFSNPDASKRVEVHMVNGTIRVRTHAAKDVVADFAGSRRREAPPGLRRIDLPDGVTVEESGNTISIRGSNGGVNLTVPVECSLKLATVNSGGITVEGVAGDIDANSLNGSIDLRDVSGAVVAHSLNGKVVVSLSKVPEGKPMSFSTLNGAVDVTLPADVKADVKMKSDNGEIWTDFDIQLSATRAADGRRGRMRFDKLMTGKINGGGAELQFTTLNGSIHIRKKK